jgi:predicted nucleic acid-binding Zn ribbon protein
VCGGKVKKIISMSSFHLKGGGWYSDGYASGSSAQKGEKKTTKTKSTENKPEKKASACGTDSTCKGCPASS